MKKTTKLISILLVLAMLLSMAPMTVFAADGHTHSLTADGEAVEFEAFPADLTTIKTAGSYYLTQDIELTQNLCIEVEGTVNLCLNGHSITATADNSNEAVIFLKSGTLNLCDCQSGGCITSTEDLSLSGVKVWSGAVFNMYGGEIDNAYYAVGYGIFNMYGGKLSGNKKSAVYVTNTFNMYGGEISGNSKNDIEGVAVEVNSGNFNMYGGEIRNNENSGTGRNASIVGINGGATFTMNGGKICDNTGTAVYCDGSFIMNGGEISGNTDDYIGGVSVNIGSFNMNGGEIKNNKGNWAGGIYIYYGSVNIKAGKITGNTAGNENDHCGGGIGFSTGSVVLSGADIQIKDNVNTATSSSSNQNVARNFVFEVSAPLDPAKTQIAVDAQQETVFAKPDGTNLTTLEGMEGCFIPPDEELVVACNENGELETVYWESSIKEKDGDLVVTVSVDSGVTYQWYQADVEELKMLVGETSNKLTNDKLVIGKTYFCKIYYNGQEIETLTIKYPYEITHQPTAGEPYVELNDDTDAAYQWYTVEGDEVEVTDDGEIGDTCYDSYYDEETGWNGDWWYYDGAYYFYVYLEEGQKITIIPSAYCDAIGIWDYYYDDYGDYGECDANEEFTYTAEVEGWYYVYAYTDYYDNTTLRAYIGDADYTEIEGETAAKLENIAYGNKYACEVTFADGTTEMSDVFEIDVINIANAEIALGDSLTYTGAEQTQTVESVTAYGLDVTYDVSGNKATNAGVYELTVTGNGDFTGTKTALYEIAPDTTAIDDLTVDNVKSSDRENIEAVKAQIDNAVTDLADDETKAEYKAIADKCDEFLKKIDDTAAEIARIDEAVNAYDEETIKSSDKEAINQLKKDIQTLIDSGNVTEEEIAALEDTKAVADALTDKIDENENQTGEDETAEKSVAEIGVELEMFDENRVTIFWEDDIEALKAKIDELLADENMGEAEKAKLNEYKAQAEKLIEIINDPCEYFSLRFFYFIWDCLTWKYNGILWIFSNLFGC